MEHHFRTNLLAILLLAVQAASAICQSVQSSSPGDGERLAVLPFEIRGITTEEGQQLRQKFCEVLGESKRFDVMPANVLRNNLELAGLSNIDSCNTLPCLAQLGKVLNVEKVIHASVDEWRERFVLHVRVVRSSDGVLLYDERADYAGDFSGMLSSVIPEQARKLNSAYLDKKPNWYLIAGVVIVGIGLFYAIFKAFGSSSSSETDSSNPPPVTH